jgi:hypothetical protein
MNTLHAADIQTLANALLTGTSPFNYPLDIKLYEGKSPDEDVILCCHGYGGDHSIAGIIASYRIVPAHLVGFNFPDYNITSRAIKPSAMTYGTVNELLPAIYLLKKIVVDAKNDRVSLYGFSAGGAAVVNLIAFLNTVHDSKELQKIGVTEENRQQILAALQKGIILIDSPLKSLDEFNAAHPEMLKDPKNILHAQRAQENEMIAIDALAKWKGLKLSVVLFLQNPDEAVSNRDDALFIERLKQANPQGRNLTLTGNEGGHLSFHTALWKGYLQLNAM